MTAIRCAASSEFQDAYRDVASRHNCILIDVQSYFHAIGRHGLLDDELFQDGMHPSLRGQLAVAQAILQALHSRGAFGWPRNSPVPLIDPAECVARFRLGPAAWRFVCLWSINFNNLVAPLRYDPGQRAREKQLYADAADRIAAGEAPESLGLPNLGTPAPIPVVPSGARRIRGITGGNPSASTLEGNFGVILCLAYSPWPGESGRPDQAVTDEPPVTLADCNDSRLRERHSNFRTYARREHVSQRGRRARHTRRPCWIRRWLRSTHWRRGITSISSRSIRSGARWDVSPNLRASRLTWVSTTIPDAIPNAVPSTTFAVLRPTPESAVRASRSRGILAS